MYHFSITGLFNLAITIDAALDIKVLKLKTVIVNLQVVEADTPF